MTKSVSPQKLIDSVLLYNPPAEVGMIEKAFSFAMEAHSAQKRASGEYYASHPIAVAQLLADKRLDTASIVAGLLHDTVEDTKVSLGDIGKLFDQEVYEIVDGLTKLSSLHYVKDNNRQAENFRKFLLASVKDIRVLLVKLADKLHNMQTLHHIESQAKKERIAQETMEIYVPLAERIGLRDWKAELEDHSFRWLYPLDWRRTHQKLDQLRDEKSDFIRVVKEDIKKLLSSHMVEAQILGREKKPYSIWRKIQDKNSDFENISDIFAIRVIVPKVASCYHVLGVLHGNYQALSNRFKDYISVPKQNGYQSIHTGILLPNGQLIEIQIRTVEMNERAEFGIAAHWHYKEKGVAEANPYDGKRFRWLTHLIEILENANDVQEFIQNSKLDLYAEAVFVFTPRGELRTLPTGATPIDLAYSLHTELGHHCIGAKVNGRIIPIRAPLQNGDIVEILTKKTQQPSREWEHYCVTGKARSAIRHYLRTQEKLYFMNLGRKLLEKKVEELGQTINEKFLQKHIKTWQCSTSDELFLKLGQSIISPTSVAKTLFPETESPEPPTRGKHGRVKKRTPDILPIGGLVERMAINMAQCCFPIPGDEIIGVIRTGKGVSVHRRRCRQISQLKKIKGDDFVPIHVYWDLEEISQGDYTFTARIRIVIKETRGAIADATTVISKQNGNITSFRTVRRNSAFLEALINLDVSNVSSLQSILTSLSNCRSVSSAARVST